MATLKPAVGLHFAGGGIYGVACTIDNVGRSAGSGLSHSQSQATNGQAQPVSLQFPDHPGGDHAQPGGDHAHADVRDHPGWSAARSVQADFGRLLLEATGGHGLDIAWVVGPDGARVPGLVIHVAPEGDPAKTGPAPMEVEVAGFEVTVPGTIELDLFGQAHAVPVRWASSPAATFEGDGPV